jgi:hypothetical protein
VELKKPAIAESEFPADFLAQSAKFDRFTKSGPVRLHRILLIFDDIGQICEPWPTQTILEGLLCFYTNYVLMEVMNDDYGN